MQGINDLFNKFIGVLMKFADLKSVQALKDGFVMTVPITIAGSVFLLLASLPFNGYDAFMAGIFGSNWTVPLYKVSGATFDILALMMAILIPYKYAEHERQDAMGCGLIGLVSFLITTGDSVISAGGETVGGVIPKTWVGGSGTITAIIMGLISAKMFCWFMKKDIRIKLPDSVPENVSRAFSALIPGFVIFLVSTVIYTVCYLGFGKTPPELIFSILQIPLMAIGTSLPGSIVMSFLITILFWAGIHGPNVIGGVMNPIWQSAALANQAILDQGGELVAGAPGVYISTIQVFDVFIKLGGCGLTIGLLIAAFLSAKSSQMKTISRLSLGCGIFNINEPVIFGLPIAFNPFYLVPFSLVPIVGLLITYISISIGFMKPFGAVNVPWTTPPIISGLLLGGFPGLVVQLLIVIASVVIYFPFVKAHDAQLLKQEQEDSQE